MCLWFLYVLRVYDACSTYIWCLYYVCMELVVHVSMILVLHVYGACIMCIWCWYYMYMVYNSWRKSWIDDVVFIWRLWNGRMWSGKSTLHFIGTFTSYRWIIYLVFWINIVYIEVSWMLAMFNLMCACLLDITCFQSVFFPSPRSIGWEMRLLGTMHWASRTIAWGPKG